MFLRFKERCRDSKNGSEYLPNMVLEFADDRAKEILSVEVGRYAEPVKLEVIKESKHKNDKDNSQG